MGGDGQKPAVGGELFDQNVKKALTAPLSLANGAQGGMHVNHVPLYKIKCP